MRALSAGQRRARAVSALRILAAGPRQRLHPVCDAPGHNGGCGVWKMSPQATTVGNCRCGARLRLSRSVSRSPVQVSPRLCLWRRAGSRLFTGPQGVMRATTGPGGSRTAAPMASAQPRVQSGRLSGPQNRGGGGHFILRKRPDSPAKNGFAIRPGRGRQAP